MALKFDRILNQNIPSKTYKNYNYKVWEKLTSRVSELSKAILSGLSLSGWSTCWTVLWKWQGWKSWSRILMNLDRSFEESTSETALKFAWNLSTRLPASPYAKKDDLRSFLSNSFTEKVIYRDTGFRCKTMLNSNRGLYYLPRASLCARDFVFVGSAFGRKSVPDAREKKTSSSQDTISLECHDKLTIKPKQ